MPRRKSYDVLDNLTARAILDELRLYGTDRQFQPVQNALFTYMTHPQYNPRTKHAEDARYPEITRGQFNYWFGQLVEAGYIVVDRVTCAVRCTDLEIVRKDEAND